MIRFAILCYVLAVIGVQYFPVDGQDAKDGMGEQVVKAPESTQDEIDHKLLHECQKSLDYRSYIRCLKREKRHEALDKRRSCLDACFEINCTTSKCIHDCHTHCRKKLIETYSKTVETYDCRDKADCGDNLQNAAPPVAPVPNITTHIHIQNIMPNNTANAAKDCDRNGYARLATTGGSADVNATRFAGVNFNGSNPWGGPGSSGTVNGSDTISTQGGTGSNVVPKIDINNIINNQYAAPSPFMGGFMGPMYPYAWPPMAMMPPQYPMGKTGQAGAPASNGCPYPSIWPCSPVYQMPNVPKDCAFCGNPFFQFYCDPNCLNSATKIDRNVTGEVSNNV